MPLPLSGRTVVVTRARAQAYELVSRLETLGARVLAFPVIELIDPDDWSPADEAIRTIEVYDWVVFTSANAVDRFFARLMSQDKDARALAGIRVAAVGTTTADRVRQRGIIADLVPARFVAEGLLEEFERQGVSAPADASAGEGVRVLLPRALEAREVLPDTLRERGVHVDVVPVYQTVRGSGDSTVMERMSEGDVDVITFTSASTVRNFVALVANTQAEDVLTTALLASIGPATTEVAADLGLTIGIEADPHTVEALVDLITDHFSKVGRDTRLD